MVHFPLHPLVQVLRRPVRSPGVTLMALVTLSVGISLVEAVLIRPLGASALYPMAGQAGPRGRPPGTQAAGAAKVHDSFLDFREIQVSAKSVETIDAETLEWGRRLLGKLAIENLPISSKASAIGEYIHTSCAFTPDRPETVSAFLKGKKGNCYAHARLGAFLLRLAGIPPSLPTRSTWS